LSFNCRAATYVNSFYSTPQCSHCKRCTSYSNSILPSVRPSVCQSVTHRYCVKTTTRSMVHGCSLHCQIAKCVWFCRNQKIFPRDDHFSLKSWLQVTYHLLIAARLDTFCLVAPQPQEIEKEVQLHLTRTRHGLANDPSTKVSSSVCRLSDCLSVVCRL